MKRLLPVALAGLLATSATAPAPPAPVSARTGTRAVLLGSGTPNADPDRSGPAVAIVVNGMAYLVDAGPGVVRRASAAERRGTPELAVKNLRIVFVTHLHSDHTAGLPDLIFTPWVLGRSAPLAVYGPAGIRLMTDHVQSAYEQDVRIRLEGLEPANETGYRVQAHEIGPGVVYRDSHVTVTAFAVAHGSWPQAFAYRFETRDRRIVISGDTRATDAIVEACTGCDLLVHEVYAQAGWERLPPDWQRYHATFHTSAVELGRLAARAQPKQLVLYHQLPWSSTPEQIVREIREHFAGPVAYGNDLDVY